MHGDVLLEGVGTGPALLRAMVLLRLVIPWLLASGAAAQPQPEVAATTTRTVPEMFVAVEIGGRIWAVDGAPAAPPHGAWQRRRTGYGGLIVKIGGARPASGPMTVISRTGACQTRALRRAVIHFSEDAYYDHGGWRPGEMRNAT